MRNSGHAELRQSRQQRQTTVTPGVKETHIHTVHTSLAAVLPVNQAVKVPGRNRTLMSIRGCLWRATILSEAL